MFQNLQSLFNKQHILEAFVDSDPTYQAFCISETWLTSNKLELIQISGYKIAASYCRRTRCGGGVCILLQENIDCINRTEIADMSMEYALEVCATEVPKINILLIVMYWNRRDEELFHLQIQKNTKLCK